MNTHFAETLAYAVLIVFTKNFDQQISNYAVFLDLPPKKLYLNLPIHKHNFKPLF